MWKLGVPMSTVKTQEQLNQDVNATIKFVLSKVEMVAALSPEEACHPVHLDETRRQIVRKIWQLYKEVRQYGDTGGL